MRNLRKLLVVFMVIATSITACKDAEEKRETSEDIQTTTDDLETTEGGVEVGVVLNANLATEADLNALGLSPEHVSEILAKRPFLSMNDFDLLLGAAAKDDLYNSVFVPFNLNTTAEADFKMIPGVGDRMAHEFEEYRPYTSIKQFKREIGKYVDEEEVERYLKYVFVPVELNTATEEDILALPGVGKRMAHEFEEYRPYVNLEQFRKEIGKYVDDKELKRLERFVYLASE